MEIIYFGDWISLIYLGINCILLFWFIFLFLKFLKTKLLHKQSTVLSESKNISIKKGFFPLSKKKQYILGVFIMTWVAYLTFFEVYSIESTKNGRLNLKNIYRVSIGIIEQNEKIEYKQTYLPKGRSVVYLYTDQKTYKTVKSYRTNNVLSMEKLQKLHNVK